MRTDASARAVRTRRALAAGVVAAAICGTALTAAPAYATTADGPIGIGRAATDAGDHGSFSVPVWTADPAAHLTSVSATVRDGDTTVAQLADLVPLTGVADTWTNDGPLELTEDGGTLPHLGAYSIDVTATDDQGDTVVRKDAGTLDFTLQPADISAADGGITEGLTLSQPVVDPDHDTESVSGYLQAFKPGSRIRVPLSGRTVTVGMTYAQSWMVETSLTAVTDASGHFTADFAVPTAGREFTATFSEDSTQVSGPSVTASATPVYNTLASAVTATASTKRVLPGQSFTISGVVHATSSTTSPGLAGVPVSAGLHEQNNYDTDRFTAVTDASGHFTVTVPSDQESDGTWGVRIEQPLRYGEADGTIAVPDESRIISVASSVSADDRVTVSGKLQRTYHQNNLVSSENVGLWYSPDGKTGWKGLAGVNLPWGDGSFKITTNGYLDGYYQVRHATSDTLAASNGPIVHLTRTNTRIFQMYANTARAKKNSTLTLTGNLKQDVGNVWKPFGGQYVELYFQPKGSTKWSYMGYSHTDSTGHARFTSKAVQDGRWLIQYFGDGTHYESDAAAVFVDVV